MNNCYAEIFIYFAGTYALTQNEDQKSLVSDKY